MQLKLDFLKRLSARRIGVLASLLLLVGGLTYLGFFAFHLNIGIHSWLSALQIWKKNRHRLVHCVEMRVELGDAAMGERCGEYEAVFKSHTRLRQSVRERDWAAAERHIVGTGLTHSEADAALSLFKLSDKIPPATAAVSEWTAAIARIGELRALSRQVERQSQSGGLAPAERRAYLKEIARIEDRLAEREAKFGELLHHASPQARYVALGSIVVALLILVATGVYLARLARRFEVRHEHVERRLADHEAKMVEADRMIAVGILAAGVGHEINNPLTYVAGGLEFAHMRLTDLIESRDYDEATLTEALAEVVEALEDAREGTMRVRDIARDLRTFARRESSEEFEQVRIVPIVDLTLEMAAHEIKHRARLVRNYVSDPVVVGNESRLAQVLLNLVINAAQAITEGATEDNEIRIVVDQDGEQVVVEVHDTGVGIAPEHQELVFEPFRTTKPQGEGMGLGLAISRNIIESMGGSLGFESTPGEGSVFWVRLPAAESDESDESDEEGAGSA